MVVRRILGYALATFSLVVVSILLPIQQFLQARVRRYELDG